MKKLAGPFLLILSVLLAPVPALAQTCPACAPPDEVLKSDDFQNIFVDASTGTFYMRDARNSMRAIKGRPCQRLSDPNWRTQ